MGASCAGVRYNMLMVTMNNLHRPEIARLLLRLGLAFVFVYAGVSSLRQPDEWIGYLPHFLASASYAETLMRVFAVYELGLALWLLSGKFVRYAAALCGLTLVGIVLADPNNLIISFRDIGLICMAVALAVSAE